MEDYRGFCYPAASEYYEPGPLPPCPPPPLPSNKKERRVVAVGEGPHPVENPFEVLPISPKLPPAHTQIQPRCFTCKHFEMCSFKKDYLKTVFLIQKDLGSPHFDYELTNRYFIIPGLVGIPILNQDLYFPKKIKFDNSDDDGKLWVAKFNGINYINVVYTSKKYYILLKLVYNKETEAYDLKSCEEAFYKIKYELNISSLEEIQNGLLNWREKIINMELPVPPPKPDVINTTHFSANLNCDMYDWNKLSFKDAIEKMVKKYPYGIPIDKDDRVLYHIATYHIEQGEVPYAPLLNGKVNKNVVPYIPPTPIKPPKPPKRRDDT